jgi:predicted transposase/invertase (TIGR01784 family)
MDLYNDISFEIGGKLVVLIEHQSTINPNMALRLLLYISRVLEKTVKGKSLYSEKPISIPYPEFYVLYNGAKPYPDEDTYKLSELYAKPQEIGLPERASPLLELEVKVININEGRNEIIVNRCKKLSEYSMFIARARNYLKEYGNIDEAVKNAVRYCQKRDILKEFLEEYGLEARNMLLTEWNWEDAKEVWREEAWEEGYAESRKTIALNLLEKGSTPEFIQEITGLDLETIQKLSS